MNLFTKDATYYANLIKQDKVTSVELVKRALANIESLNPMLNAVTHVQKEYALKRAQVLDENKDKLHTLPPFYGVPTLLKDVGQQQAGFPATIILWSVLLRRVLLLWDVAMYRNLPLKGLVIQPIRVMFVHRLI